MNENEYKNKTKLAYQNNKTAFSYKKAYEERWSRRNYRVKMIAVNEQKAVKKLLNIIKNENIEKALDIPAGTGKITRIILDNNFKLISADISAEMLGQIDKELLNHKNYIESMVADASELPFEDNSFDLITNIRLLHRVPMDIKKKILLEANRVSNKYFIVSFGIESFFQKIRFFFREKFITKQNSSPGRDTKRNIEREIKNANFKIIKMKRVIPFLSNEVIYLLKTR